MEILIPCKHERFDVDARVRNLKELKDYYVDFHVKCAECSMPFKFEPGEIAPDEQWVRMRLVPMHLSTLKE